MENIEQTAAAGDHPLLLLLMVVVSVLVFRNGIRNYRSTRLERRSIKPLRDRVFLWAKGTGLMLAAGIAIIWPAGRLSGAW